jgi:hypothetical protein
MSAHLIKFVYCYYSLKMRKILRGYMFLLHIRHVIHNSKKG